MDNTEDLSIVRPELLQIAEAVAGINYRSGISHRSYGRSYTDCCKEKVWTRASN